MPLAFFEIPSHGQSPVVEQMNAFIAAHSGTIVAREWRDGGSWAIVVEYSGDGVRPQKPSPGGIGQKPSMPLNLPKVDYQALLSPEAFSIYDHLRGARKIMADKEGVKAFVVFTNAQLAEIAKKPCRTLADLNSIPGLGEARITKYGAEILAEVANLAPSFTLA